MGSKLNQSSAVGNKSTPDCVCVTFVRFSVHLTREGRRKTPELERRVTFRRRRPRGSGSRQELARWLASTLHVCLHFASNLILPRHHFFLFLQFPGWVQCESWWKSEVSREGDRFNEKAVRRSFATINICSSTQGRGSECGGNEETSFK